MNKVELAKMIGLKEITNSNVDKWQITDLLESDWMFIDKEFNSFIVVFVKQEDLAKDKLDIKLEDLEREEDLKVCCKQIEELLWKRAADIYLEKVHRAATLIG